MSVAFVRDESAGAAREVTLPPRAISTHPNLVTQSGLRALERVLVDSRSCSKPRGRYRTPTSGGAL
jgi:hypothetical protein